MLPVRLHFDLEAPGWGGLGFRIVLLLIPGSQISVWHCCGLSVFVVPLPYQSLGDTKLSSLLYIARTMN